MVDTEKERALTILTNFTFPKRKKDVTTINKLRKDIANIVFK